MTLWLLRRHSSECTLRIRNWPDEQWRLCTADFLKQSDELWLHESQQLIYLSSWPITRGREDCFNASVPEGFYFYHPMLCVFNQNHKHQCYVNITHMKPPINIYINFFLFLIRGGVYVSCRQLLPPPSELIQDSVNLDYKLKFAHFFWSSWEFDPSQLWNHSGGQCKNCS